MIDAHCHISMYPDSMRASLLSRLAAEGFEALLLAGYDPSDWQTQLDIQASSPAIKILPVFGLHPWHLESVNDQQFDEDVLKLERALDVPEVVACGELGLDYFKVKAEAGRKRQQSRLEAILDVVCSKKLPLVLHCVRAHHDMIRILKARKKDLSGGMVHSFVGHTQVAWAYWDLGFCTSISPMTQRVNRDLLYREMPLDFILLESDAPQPIDPKGSWEPKNMTVPTVLRNIAKPVAKARNISIADLFKQNRSNILRHFPRTHSVLTSKSTT